MPSRFVRYVGPVLDALTAMGGSARPPEVQDWVAQSLNVSDEERAIENKNGVIRFENDVAWARFYLVRAGYIDRSKFGVWSLTERGRTSGSLDEAAVLKLVRGARRQNANANADRGGNSEDDSTEPGETIVSEEGDILLMPPTTHRELVIGMLRSLPPAGFERLCQRLLRESGFEQVVVTGRSGDGGIDGVGVLRINPFVSFKVFFQSKRYMGSVGSDKIRDFRGAMSGRTDKGLVLTTGTFTTDARAEAVRDGVPPIELVDGHGLITLLEQLEVGVRPIQSYVVDEAFFDEFRSDS